MESSCDTGLEKQSFLGHKFVESDIAGISYVTNKKKFWNDKILGWEAGRYEPGSKSRWSLVERLANRSSESLRHRQQLAVSVISEYVQGRQIVEFGCGSGLLAERYIKAGAKSYLGVDIADKAIDEANRRKDQTVWGERAKFVANSVVVTTDIEADAIVVSFGLLDWLTEEERGSLFSQQGKADFLHSISEQRVSISQLLHRFYVYIAYGFRTKKYVPKYMFVQDIADELDPHHDRQIYLYRHRQLSFGAFLSSFPIGTKIGR